MKKITAIALASALSLAVFSGCSEQQEDPNVLKIGDFEIKASEYAYTLNAEYLSIDEQLGGMLSSGEEAPIEGLPTKEEALETAREFSIEVLKEQTAIKTIIAENGVTLDEDDEKEIDAIVESTKERLGGVQAFKAQIKANGMTEEYFRSFYADQILFEKVAANIYGNGSLSDDELYAIYEDEYMVARHIFVDTTQIIENAALSDDPEFIVKEMAKAQAKIDEAMAKINAGEEFLDVSAEYTEDFQEPPTGYAYTGNFMPEEFDNALSALSDGEVSEVVATDLGFHIIQKVPHTEENFLEYKNQITLGDDASKIYDDLALIQESLEIEEYPEFLEINFDNMAEYFIVE